jgi:hypothetical protein
MVDFMTSHSLFDTNKGDVFRNRESYAGYFILAVVEMLKYAIKEDYENSKTEMQLIPVQFEYIKPSKNKQKLMKDA